MNLGCFEKRLKNWLVKIGQWKLKIWELKISERDKRAERINKSLITVNISIKREKWV